MRRTRIGRGVLAGLVAATVLAPAASAATEHHLAFLRQPYGAGVTGLDLNATQSVRVDVLRDGALLGTGTAAGADLGRGATAAVSALRAGDVANLYGDGVLVETLTYDGLPAFDVCAGAQTFTGTHAPAAVIDSAGVLSTLSPQPAPEPAAWDALNPFTITLTRPVTITDSVFVTTREERDTVSISSLTLTPIGPCGGTPPPLTGVSPGPFSQSTGEAADALTRFAVRTGLDRAVDRLRAQRLRRQVRGGSITVPFALSEAGTLTVTLTAPGSRRIGTGTLTTAGAGRLKVAIKLNAAGRRALARSGPLKLQLRAAFVPARAGGKPQAASRTVTLRR